MNRHHLDGVALVHVEQGLNDLHLLAHPLPVEKVLKLFRGKMNEDSVIGLYRFYQQSVRYCFQKAKRFLPPAASSFTFPSMR